MVSRIIPVEDFDLVIFGATGDLARRKILPGLYRRYVAGQIPGSARIIGAARTRQDDAAFRDEARAAIREFASPGDDASQLDDFLNHLGYVPIDARGTDGWDDLRSRIRPGVVHAFYFSVAPALFGDIAQRLADHGIADQDSRIVVEKPFGRDLATARELNAVLARHFSESQIYRIDHYLGKETVQNLMAVRFANMLFEPLWNSLYVDHVQITVAETVGVEGRGGYYDTSGALRDMVQNHLMQLLCLVGMEPPVSLDQESVRDEKIKVLRSLKPIGPENVAGCTVRGQYRAGAVEGAAVGSYAEEAGTAPGAKPSNTETFVALKVEIENWRWSGVPFYLRTGKRMPAKVSEIVIQFRQVPHSIFPKSAGEITPNLLIVRLQPDESIRLNLMAKDPGPGGMRLREASLNLSFAETFKFRFPDAYERLLMDVVRGNPTLFMRRDEVEAAWRWTESILDAWEARGDSVKPYIAGTWGPSQSVAMIERDGRTWHDDAMSNG